MSREEFSLGSEKAPPLEGRVRHFADADRQVEPFGDEIDVAVGGTQAPPWARD